MSGGLPITSADRALEHVARLQRAVPGLTVTHVARLAGLSSSLIGRARRTGRLTEETESRILAVTLEHVCAHPPSHIRITPVLLDHLNLLMSESGLPPTSIARAAGLTPQGVYKVLGRDRTSEKVTYRVFVALMSLTVDDVRRETAFVDRTPYVTMLRALQANGWPLEDGIGREYGFDPMRLVLSPPETRMMSHVARAIETLYRDIGDTPGPSLRAANAARRLGYFPPMHYDEDMTLVRQRPTKDQAAAEERSKKARTHLRIIALTLMAQSGSEIAAATGVTKRTVARLRVRVGLTIVHDDITKAYAVAETIPGARALARTAVLGIDPRNGDDRTDDYEIDYTERYSHLLDAISALSSEEGAA